MSLKERRNRPCDTSCAEVKMSGLRRGELSENGLLEHGSKITYQTTRSYSSPRDHFLVPGKRPVLSCICSRLLPLVHENLANDLVKRHLAVLPIYQHRSAELITTMVMIMMIIPWHSGPKGRCGPASQFVISST